MQNYLSKGETITAVAPSTVTDGVPILIGAALFGVPITNAASGASFAMVTAGVFSGMPKATGAAWAVGDILYWDNTAKNFTKVSTSNTRVGIATVVAASGDTVGTVKIGPAIG